MSLPEFIDRLAGILDRAGIEYMFCGSIASTFHGVPRTTRDVDLVVALSGPKIPVLLGELPEEDYYVSESSIRDAVLRQSQFNVIDMATGWKADLIVKKRRPFSTEEFKRRVQARVLGDAEVFIASPEDTVLTKLEWAAATNSERQLRDVAGVIQVKGADLDLEYLRHWAAELGVLGQLEQLLKP